MSEYEPKEREVYARRAINSAIYRYPEMYVELVDGANDVIYGTPAREVSVICGTSDPTASKAIQLSNKKRIEYGRKCEAINYCLSLLVEQYRQVVCLRFWGTRTTEEAFKIIRDNEKLRGLPYESCWSINTLPRQAGYEIAQVKRICSAFFNSVGQELGEI